MAEDFKAINKTLKETTNFLKEKAAKDAEEAAKTRATLEKTAASTGKSLKDIKDRASAKLQIKKQDEAVKVASENKSATMKLLGISQKRMDKADKLSVQIEAQEKIMSEQKASIEASGLKAEKVPKFQKAQIKLDEMKAKKEKTMGAAASEDDAKAGAKDSKMLTYMKNTAGFLGGIAKQGMQKVKSGLGGFSKFLFGALAVAALAFLDHPKFKEMIITLKDVVIPALAYLYDNVIKPLAIYIGGLLTDLFTDLKSYIDGEKGLGAVIFDNIGIIAGIVTALAPGLVFGALKLAVTGLVKGAMLLAKGGIFAKIGVAFTALKTFFTATLLPAVTGFMVPLLPIIAIIAGIVLVLNSLKNAFDDFMFELEATGSIWEATKTGIVSVISNILGLPFDLLKDGVSWIIGKIGSVFGLESFTNASKFLDKIDIVQELKDFFIMIGDTISGIWDGLLNAIQDILRSPKLKFLGGGFAADALFGTEEEQAEKKKAKAEEQKQFELNRKALKEKQKLEKAIEKEAEEAKKLEKVKTEQEAKQEKKRKKLELEKKILGPKANAFLAEDLKPRPAESGAGANIVNAPTSVVNAPSSSNTSVSTPLRQPNAVISQLASAA